MILLLIDCLCNQIISKFQDSSADLEPRRKKKRQSRWVTSEKDPKSFIPGMPTIIPSNMTKEQEKAYLSKRWLVFVLIWFWTNQTLNESL